MASISAEELSKRRANAVQNVERILSYSFSDPHLLAQALTHPSAVEGERDTQSYERLEFLGDALLGASIALEVYERFPQMDEGLLTRIKVFLVSGKNLSQQAARLGLEKYIIFGKSEAQESSRGHTAALENVFEALVGALYLDGGKDAAEKCLLAGLKKQLDTLRLEDLEDPKSRLQALTQKKYNEMPVYNLIEQTGPAHAPLFKVEVRVGKTIAVTGTGFSKKSAEVDAAAKALEEVC